MKKRGKCNDFVDYRIIILIEDAGQSAPSVTSIDFPALVRMVKLQVQVHDGRH